MRPPIFVSPRRRRAALTELDKPEVLDLDHFTDGGGVMHFGNRHIFGAEPRLFIGLMRGQPGQVVLVIFRRTVGARAQDRGLDLDRAGGIEPQPLEPFARAQHGRRGTVRDRGAHRQVSG